MNEPQPRSFRTLREPGEAELEIKRSRFLAQARPVHDEEAIRSLLAGVRATHPDAGHHAFAYRLGREGEAGRFSDDGEPGGTAGRPIMEVLLREEVVDAVVVVTRYFGGVLLGSGGLTRAYGQAASEAVRRAGFTIMRPHTALAMTIDYTHLGALEQALSRADLTITASTYTDRVTLVVPVPSGDERKFVALAADLTAGSAVVTAGSTIYVPE